MRAITLILGIILALTTASSDKKVVCYFGSWAVYRPGNGKIDISEIDPTLCTHLIYTFMGIGEDGSVRILDSWADLPNDYGKDGFGKFNKLRERNPNLKTMVAIGGWNEGSTKYSHVVNNPKLRRKFVDVAYDFVKKYGFDGFDFDWEYPNQRQGVETDKKNYVLLLKELKQKFEPEGLILSAAVGAAEVSASKSYIISEMSKHLDFINLMAYDLHGIWDHKTGVNAPLYVGSWEKGDDRKLNVNASVHYWLSQGAPAEKLILGVPFYARGFTLANSSNDEIGAPANQAARAGRYTREPGMLGYNEICEMLKSEEWVLHFQEEQRVPYAVKGNQWIGYDDPRSLKEKAEYVKKMGLGGMMVWSVETDDFKGICGEKYPLLKTINSALKGDVVSSFPMNQNETVIIVESNKEESNKTASSSEIFEEEDNNKFNDEQVDTDNEVDEDKEPVHDEEPSQNNDDKHEEPKNDQNLPVSDPICKGEGYFADPEHPKTFYHCQLFVDHYIKYTFQCPESLVFNNCSKTCTWNYQNTVC